MNKKNKNLWQSVTSSKLPMMLFFGILLATSTLSHAQDIARMQITNEVTIQTGLKASYLINVDHFGFADSQEAVTYFQARHVDYINFVVIDKSNVSMNLDLTNPAVATWTLADWKQALSARAANASPRVLPTY